MTKIASIGFVCILVLNTMGYFGAFLGLHLRNDIAMSHALDADIYEPSNTLTIQFPVSIPYMPDQDEFERVKGEFEHNGNHYRLVKQKYARDTLTVVCVLDPQHKKIDLALADYITSLLDKTPDAKSTTKFQVSFIKDYISNPFAIASYTSGWALSVYCIPTDQQLDSNYIFSILRPPDFT